jgi:cysteine desulfurase
VTTAVEHHAVTHTLRYLEKFGFEVVTLGVDRYGRVDPDDVEAALTDRTILVAVQLANNEVGTIQPVAEIGRRVREHRGVVLAVDAVQAAPYVDINVAELGAHFVAIAGHKLEGPKGIGALWIRHGTHLLAQQHGGSQERHRRAGTEDVAGAVGMAVAYDLACDERPVTARRLRRLRGKVSTAVLAVSGTELPGHPSDRLPGHLSFIVRDVDGGSAVAALDLEGIACSTGSACTTGSTEVSHVLTAMAYPDEEARGSLRVSLGRTTSDADVDAAVTIVPEVIERLRLAAAELATEPIGQAVL